MHKFNKLDAVERLHWWYQWSLQTRSARTGIEVFTVAAHVVRLWSYVIEVRIKGSISVVSVVSHSSCTPRTPWWILRFSVLRLLHSGRESTSGPVRRVVPAPSASVGGFAGDRVRGATRSIRWTAVLDAVPRARLAPGSPPFLRGSAQLDRF